MAGGQSSNSWRNKGMSMSDSRSLLFLSLCVCVCMCVRVRVCVEKARHTHVVQCNVVQCCL